MRFRKKPVVIEAVQFRNDQRPYPEGVCLCGCITGQAPLHSPHIHTLEGPLSVTHLDWIITGVKGEKYPCKPDIFEATYDPVVETVEV